MEKQNRLPNVTFMSPKASKMIESITTEDVSCIDTEANGINVKNALLHDDDIDKTAVYRNIYQMWHPADEQPNCIGPILCWCSNGTFFVHHHYSYIYEHWHLFVSVNNVKRYCYIANLRKDMYF